MRYIHTYISAYNMRLAVRHAQRCTCLRTCPLTCMFPAHQHILQISTSKYTHLDISNLKSQKFQTQNHTIKLQTSSKSHKQQTSQHNVRFALQSPFARFASDVRRRGTSGYTSRLMKTMISYHNISTTPKSRKGQFNINLTRSTSQILKIDNIRNISFSDLSKERHTKPPAYRYMSIWIS